jgi:hypothetical protein
VNINQKIFLEALSRFVTHSNNEAAMLFAKLDPHLSPHVTAIVVPFSKSAGRTFILPKSSEIAATWFCDVEEIAKSIPLTYLSDLAPDVQGVLWQEKVRIWKTIRSVVESKCGQLGYSAFAMYPAFIQGFSVALTLHVSREVLDSYYSLTRYPNWGYPATSLIYETIAAFLYKSVTPLQKLSSGVTGNILSEDGDEVLRKAGYWLMDALEKSSRTDSENAHTENLFRICNIISSQFYEGAETRGRMLISRRNHPNTGQVIRLQKAVTMRNYRGIRKLLEICTSDLHLLCDSSGIYGIGKRIVPDDLDPNQDLFVVDFIGHYRWRLSHAGHDLMVVSYGQPQLPQKSIDEEDFRSRILAEFGEIEFHHLRKLWALVCEAPKQQHGTTIVISDRGEEESKRLHAQSTVIEPIQLSSELMLPMSSIDGAILIDPRSTCYAMGVILDGLANGQGDSARGARYNSAVRYLDHARARGHRCVIVLISEDGSTDIL